MFSGFKQFLDTVRLDSALQHFTHTSVHLRNIRGVSLGQLEENRADSAVKVDIVFFLVRNLFAGAAKIESLLHSLDRRHKACFQFFRKLHIFNRPIEAGKLLRRRTFKEILAVKAVEHLRQHF